jgi:hypothetical protein
VRGVTCVDVTLTSVFYPGTQSRKNQPLKTQPLQYSARITRLRSRALHSIDLRKPEYNSKSLYRQYCNLTKSCETLAPRIKSHGSKASRVHCTDNDSSLIHMYEM